MNAHDIVAWLGRHVSGKAQLCLDTRQLRAGDVFFACPGASSDGRHYMEQAARQGAAAIVVQADADGSAAASAAAAPAAAASALRQPVLQVADLRGKLGAVADLWYGEPSAAMSVVAITGTNGKTSCAQWLAAALNTGSVPCGTIGTLGVSLPDGSRLDGALTTPDVLTLHRDLAVLRDAGAQVVALEASSIGIEQGRLDGVRVAVAGFTNLTRDHLDYHLTLQNYKLAKFELFKRPELRCAIVNADDQAGAELLAMLPPGIAVAYSAAGMKTAAVRAQDIHTAAYGLVFNLCMQSGTVQLLTRLIGAHNASNLLLVAAALQELGWGLHKIARILQTLRPVEGRLQVIEAPAPAANAAPLAVVDYAHTPDALEHSLFALREVAETRGGKLVCVFGCGGSRDRGKRPEMGRIAAELADRVILTSDNPREEDPLEIVGEIMQGMPEPVDIELDRALAILGAIWGSSPADVVLIAGKGHETYQEAHGKRVPFDDREWARFALAWLRGPSLSTDTRGIGAGQLFVALKGESFDGHAYLRQAEQAGACAAVVERRDPSVPLHQFVLGDTRQALIRAATAWRRTFDLPVIAVTGSNGKTTTKEMIAAILRQSLGEAGLATRGNLNNDIGVPLTVLRLTRSHRAAVFELGMNHPGEIALLAQIAQPTIALVNNAQREHQEFMHTVEAVARENGSVFDYLPAEGLAVFPGDDAYTELWQGLAQGRRISLFGFDPGFDVYADQIRAEPTRTLFQLHAAAGSADVTLSAAGAHNLRNALAAAACALGAGVPLSDVARGLEAFNPVAGRMQLRMLAEGFQLIDDTYNANPDSVRAAIDVLAGLAGKKILVLGDMGEVGPNGRAMHAEVGAYARERGIDILLAFGPASAEASRAFGPQGRAFDSMDVLTQSLADLTPANILVKGSRSTRMERVVKALEEQLIDHVEGGRNAT